MATALVRDERSHATVKLHVTAATVWRAGSNFLLDGSNRAIQVRHLADAAKAPTWEFVIWIVPLDGLAPAPGAASGRSNASDVALVAPGNSPARGAFQFLVGVSH